MGKACKLGRIGKKDYGFCAEGSGSSGVSEWLLVDPPDGSNAIKNKIGRGGLRRE